MDFEKFPPSQKRIRSLDSSPRKSQHVKSSLHRDEAQGSRRNSTSRLDDKRTSSTSMTGMTPLLFNRVVEDIQHPLSSLRSCSEFGFHGVPDSKSNDDSKPKTSFWSSLAFWKSKKKEDKPKDYFTERILSEEFNNNSYNSRKQSLEETLALGCMSMPNTKGASFSSCQDDYEYRRRRQSRTSISGEFHIALDVIFGYSSNKYAPMEIELKNLKDPAALAQIPRNNVSFPDLTIQRTLSYRSLNISSDDESISSSPRNSEILSHPITNFTHSVNTYMKLTVLVEDFFAKLQRYCFFPSDNEFYYALQVQPFSSGIYLRGMLISGFSNMLFHTYNYMFVREMLPSQDGLSSIQLLLQYFLLFSLMFQFCVNLMQIPFRTIIHYRCWLTSRAFDRDNACQILQDLLQSKSWIANRILNWATDGMAIHTLVMCEVYSWYRWFASSSNSPQDPLLILVASMSSTNVLSFIVRCFVTLVFFISFFDMSVLSSENKRRGLSRIDLQRMPTFVYSARDDVMNCDCSICLTSFSRGEMLISLPCDNRHSFHADCIRKWLLKTNACPLCQKIIN